MKKKWDKPELTVLVRGTAEEAVLAACKNDTTNGPVTGTHSCRAASCSCHSGYAPCSAWVGS